MASQKSIPPNRPPREIVYKNLKRQILSGEVPLGSRLIESSLADKLKASRTIIREAIKQLELEGLVRVIPYKGTEMTRLSLEDIKEIYAIQAALEGMAASLATQRINDEEIKELRHIQKRLRAAIQEDSEVWQRLNVSFHQFFWKRAGTGACRA